MHLTLRDIRRNMRKAIGPFLALALFGYFTYHSLHGSRGLLAWAQVSKNLEKANDELASLIKERILLEKKVAGLRPESINRDLLEQQVRLLLGYSHPEEIIILLNDDQQK